MASNFPTSLDSFTVKVDATDYPTAAHINDLQNAVVATQTKAGIDDSADTDSLSYQVENMWATIYPVGSIYTSIVSTNPGTLFGGTWTAFGAGKMLVGLNSGDTAFDTAEETGGAKTHTLTAAEMPVHTHTQNAHTHTTSYPTDGGNDPIGGNYNISTDYRDPKSAGNKITISNTTATNQNAGSGSAHANLPPYIVVYFFKRTA